MADDLDVEIEVLRQAANDLKLLVILAAKNCYMGTDDIKKLRHHRRHAAKVAGPHSAAQRLTEFANLDSSLETLGINFFHCRMKQDIDAGVIEQLSIPCEVARVAGEIFLRRELRRVNEQRDHDPVPACLGVAHETQMALMKRAHRRHQGDPPSLAPRGFAP